jgi:predicted O-linked N-acetylglucosamine transferase (SPINDLY family)
MPSLIELVEKVNQGELIDPALLEIYQDSANAAEKFLAHHAHALLQLRQSNQHMLSALEAIDYSDQKVLGQYVNVCSFLGLVDQRSAPMIRFGAAAIARRELSVGLEAIQSGVSLDFASGSSFMSDRENCLHVAAQYERAAQALGWSPAEQSERAGRPMRIGYVVSAVADDEPSSRFILGLSRHLDGKRFQLHVYSTEAFARRERSQFAHATYQPASNKRGRETLEQLKQRKTPFFAAALDGDLSTAARELATQISRDQIDVLLIDASQNDPIAAMLGSLPVGRARVNLVRRRPLFANGIDALCYLDPSRFEQDRDFFSRRGASVSQLLEGVDTDEPTSPAPQRSAYGIPEQAFVLATSSEDLQRSVSAEFVEGIIGVLRAHPSAVMLLIGEGELTWQKRRFESAGVAKRIGFAGKRRDLPGFLRIADLYLAEFPVPSAAGVLQAMSQQRPVVAVRWSDAPEHRAAADFVGDEATVGSRDIASFVERVGKLIRDPQTRQKLGESLRHRAEQHYSFASTTRQIERLCEQVLNPGSDATPLADAPIAAIAA